LSARDRLVAVGRVGRPHGRDGAFWVEGALVGEGGAGERPAGEGAGGKGPPDPLAPGSEVTLKGKRTRVERRSGPPGRPLVRVSGVGKRSQAAALRGEPLLVPEARVPLGQDEWLVDDLVGARVEGMGEVRRVLAGSSCDLLEVGDEAALVPLVSDAIVRIDPGARVIEVNRRFLGVQEDEIDRTAAAGSGDDVR
jgi:16S rRNA processing protein RimM